MKFNPVLSILLVALFTATGVFAQAAQDTTVEVADDSLAVLQQTTETAGDSIQPADSTLEVVDSIAVVEDSLAAAKTDSVSTPAVKEPTPEERKKLARKGKDEIVGEVVPWDWDDYTNVIEVGVRTEQGREYELEKNDHYQNIFDHFLGTELRLFGDASRDDDGFYFFRVDDFEMADSTAKPPAKLP